jgi:hypothetical protein
LPGFILLRTTTSKNEFIYGRKHPIEEAVSCWGAFSAMKNDIKILVLGDGMCKRVQDCSPYRILFSIIFRAPY